MRDLDAVQVTLDLREMMQACSMRV
jgi:hypothetical protein